MNLDSLSFALSQINYLIANLNKKNFKSSQAEIGLLIENNGFEAERYLFRCLVSSIDFASDVKSTGKDLHQTQLFKECLVASLYKPSFSSVLCYAIENPLQFQESQKFPTNLVSQISKLLKLTQLQEIVLAILLKESAKEDVKKSSLDLLKQKLPEFIDSFNETTEAESLTGLPIETLHSVLLEIERHYQANGQSGENLDQIINKLFKDKKQRELIEPFLSSSKRNAQLLKPTSSNQTNSNFSLQDKLQLKNIKMENSIVDLIQEVGFSFTANVDECRSTLMTFLGQQQSSADGQPAQLSATTIA